MVYGGNRIMLTELKPDLTGTKPGGVNKAIIEHVNAVFGADQGGLCGEGSQLSKINGRYYLLNIASPGSRWARTDIVHRADAIDGPYGGRIALDDLEKIGIPFAFRRVDEAALGDTAILPCHGHEVGDATDGAVVLHYKLTDRRDSELWRYCAAMPIPDTLAHQIEVFRDSGRVVVLDSDGFAEPSWISILAGLGVLPRNHSPFVDTVDEQSLRAHFGRLRKAITAAVAAMPDHADYIDRHAKALVEAQEERVPQQH